MVRIVAAKEGRSRSTNRRGVLIFCNKVKTLNFLMDFLAKKLDVPASKVKHGDGAATTLVPETAAEFAKRKRKKTSVVALHGKMSQEARDAALVDFRSGKKSILIATGADIGATVWFLLCVRSFKMVFCFASCLVPA